MTGFPTQSSKNPWNFLSDEQIKVCFVMLMRWFEKHLRMGLVAHSTNHQPSIRGLELSVKFAILQRLLKIPFACQLQKRSHQTMVPALKGTSLHCQRSSWEAGCAGRGCLHLGQISLLPTRGSENSLDFGFQKQLCKYVSASLVTGSTCTGAGQPRAGVRWPEAALILCCPKDPVW